MLERESIVKGIGVILMIISLFVGLMRPVNQRIDSLQVQMEKLEKRSQDSLKNLREEIFRTLDNYKELSVREQRHNDKIHDELKRRIKLLEKIQHSSGG